ncbi:outer membrane lipoprotein-sorting protein [Methanohalophilus sp. RSK]|uniref:outer membrane lipoprotein-sorting protein n=1 Tax=Methanohalophilus sp. RSK TaxID=2485783 RepID=UPI000F43BF31|nr:outer membrane lipoprotein-sorting protein [Methanohalophilus sp. RSK]RNI13741.1 outer membrane lipoprotein-sorting protein [Methanohalophilus sp. RSK]
MSTKKIIMGMLAISILVLSSGCVGGDLTAEQIAEQFEQKQDNIQDYSATIHMATFLEGNEDSTVARYEMKKPNMMRTEIIESSSSGKIITVSNGSTTWTYNPDENTVMVLESLTSFNESDFDYLNLIQDTMENNEISLEGEEKIDDRDSYIIAINPRENENNPANTSYFPTNVSTRMWLDKETWLPLKYEMYNDGEKLMVVEYRDLKINTGIEDSEFNFKIPEDAKVVRYDDINDMVPEDLTLEKAMDVSENEILVPSYLPEGCELQYARVNNNSALFGGPENIISLYYQSGDGFLHITETFYEEEPSLPQRGEPVTVNGNEARLTSYPDGGSTHLSWNRGKCMVTIMGSVDSDEIVRIAESME